MTYPLPSEMIRGFAKEVGKLAVVEELDPFIEEQVKALGVKVHYGKNVLPICGEYSKDVVFESLGGGATNSKPPVAVLIGSLTSVRAVAQGAIRSFPDSGAVSEISAATRSVHCRLSALHACTTWAQHTVAHGTAIGLQMQGIKEKPVVVIGDSTFLHSGITGLMNLIYNGGEAIVVIMNNDTTGMTGGQEHPGTGWTASGKKAPKVDIGRLCNAVGASRVPR
jgi:indolepyruvate ferredoxin oxidoreductase alpha subunit